MWRLRVADVTAFDRVAYIEILFRRIVRWELRGRFGLQWYRELGPLTSEIEKRIEAERKSGLHARTSTELSYLSFSDLLYLIFSVKWSGVFESVFSRKRSLRADLLKTVGVVRNKVAHFRPVNQQDLGSLEIGEGIVQVLKDYYSAEARTRAFLSGEPSKASEQIDPDAQEELVHALTSVSLDGVWNDYTATESIRASGIFPGIGINDHHLFYELYCKGSFNGKQLNVWLDTHRHEITYLNIGPQATYLRVFIPLVLGDQVIRKVMRGLRGYAASALDNKNKTAAEVLTEFDFGSFEYVNGTGHNLWLSYAF